MKAIILVGGQATRLRPLTLTIPKALIVLHGKPVAEHVLDLFKKYGVTEIIFSVGYLKEKIIEHFGNGKKFGFEISYIEEDEPLGTAGPLRQLWQRPDETFIVCNGDELKEIDIDAMQQFHQQQSGLATLALRSVEDPSAYGVARMVGDQIQEFVEKPKREEAPSNLINAGFYMMEPAVIDLIPEGKAMFEYDVFPQLARQGQLYGFKFSGQWFDTGNFERLEIAEREWRGL